MGCYLSTVDDKVYLTEGKGRNFKWATASCQGWRREQEDAEACITDFDKNASLFVLCDGHGGAEVAQYTVAHLPDFIKNHELYKTGDYKKALEQAFIDFDALLRTDDVMEELKKLGFDEVETKDEEPDEEIEAKEEPQPETSAGPSASGSGAGSGSSSGYQTASTSGAGSSKSNGASTIAEDVDGATLRREALVPIAEIMLKYTEGLPKSRVQSLRHPALGASPVIRNREAGDEQEPKASGSGTNDKQPRADEPSMVDTPSSTSGNFPLQSNLDILKNAIEKHFNPEEDDSEDDSEFQASDDSEDDSEDDEEDDDDQVGSRSDTEDDSDENEDDGDDEGDAESEGKRCKVLSKKQRRSLQNRAETTSSDEESERNSEDSKGDSEEGSDGSQSDDEEDDDEDDDGGDLMSGGLLSVSEFRQSLKSGAKVHTPGMDSGCTVVVALVKDGQLYVASAGDSRCIVVMRDGKCIPMSFDHKPETKTELIRITKAGGFVSEGRVNGGLNLSRAFGDFTYKSPKRPAPQQMITPCPDVKTTPIDPKEVGYIFLACDGIWNSMKNNQVATFIRQTEPRVADLSDVCAALFKECLAPTTDGDGTGCDNMTCILVKYDNPNEEDVSPTNKQIDLKSTITSDENKKAEDEKKEDIEIKCESSIKRQAEEVEDDGHHNKKRCLRLLESEVLMRELPSGSPNSSIATNLTLEKSQG